MKANSSLNRKLLTYWDDVVEQGYAELRELSACAGIKGELNAANKARWNHYGEIITRSDGSVIMLPARQWVNAGLTDRADKYTARLAQVIKERIKAARPYRNTYVTYSGTQHRVQERTTAFGGTNVASNSPRMIMEAIGNQMAENQRNIILRRQLAPNKPSTVARKHGNMPMVWTGEMFSEIRGWVETK